MKKLGKRHQAAVSFAKEHPELSWTKVGELYGIDRHQISKYIKDDLYLKYSQENQSNPEDEFLYYFTDEELSFVEVYLSNPFSSYNEVIDKAKKLNIYTHPTEATLSRWLKILGKNKTVGKSLYYHYDRNKFMDISAEDDAYWLGFVTADGCLVNKQWLQLGAAQRDEEHIKKFCHFIGYSEEEINKVIYHSFGGAYTRDNPVCTVKVCSQQIINNLKDKGLEHRKSGREKPYKCKTLELEKAYVRGLIDGDGWLGKTQYRIGICGSEEICSYVKNFFNENIVDVSNNSIYQDGKIYRFSVSGKNKSSQIAQFLYKDANIYLQRKYDLFLERYQ